MQQSVKSPSGTISAVTTERGLPVAMRIDAVELRKPPQQLANDIMALCRLAAARAQVARRRELIENGVTASVIHELHLATEEELAHAEEAVGGEDDHLPPTWMRSV